MNSSMLTVSEKMKELFQAPSLADQLVEDLTAETLEGPDWFKSLQPCDLINHEKITRQDVARALKKRIVSKNTRVQLLTLALLETCVKNCQKMFSDVSSEHVLDEMVKLVDDPETAIVNRDKALKLVEAWGESTQDLRYLPTFEETYKSLKSRGVKFPPRDPESLAPIFTPPQSVTTSAERNNMLQGNSREAIPHAHSYELSLPEVTEVLATARNCIDLLSTVLTSSPQQEALQDDLTIALVDQCLQLQFAVQRIVELVGDDEALLFEALNVNDELLKVHTKFEEMQASSASQPIQYAQALSMPASEVLACAAKPAGYVKGDVSGTVSDKVTQIPRPLENNSASKELDQVIFGTEDGISWEADTRQP